MVDNEQVAAAGRNCDSNNNTSSSISNNILCDIIAQQREFQLRQETRPATMMMNYSSSSSSAAAVARGSRQQERKLSNWRNSIDSSGQNESAVAANANTKHRSQRRKFSLSHAMSNLAPFGGSSSSSTSSGCLDKQQKARALDRHRSSLVGAGGGANGDPVLGMEANSAAASGDQATSQQEKKRSFVHKAIRRGSKLFDSMLLSASQQHQATVDLDEPTAESKEPRKDSSERQPQQRVQFAAEPTCHEADEFSQPREPHKPHKRRLRLGSLQYDLRRALSLSATNHQTHGGGGQNPANHLHKSHHASTKHLQQAAPGNGSTSGQPSNGTAAAAAAATLGGLQQQPSGQTAAKLAAGAQLTAATSAGLTASMSLSRKSTTQADKLGGGGNPNSSARLKRKNSLFAPLTSAASSAFYHAHHPSHLVRRRESTVAGLGGHTAPSAAAEAQAPSPNAAAGPQTNSQSASFSLCQDHNRTYKLIIFGSSAVGKTSIIQRFLYGHFPVAHKPTVEELHSNKYNIPELGEIYLEILDTSGTFEFPAMRRLSIEKGDAFILVFSVDDEASWQEVVHLRQLILEEKRERSQEEKAEPAASAKAAANNNNTGNQIINDRRASQAVAGSQASANSCEPPISSVYAAAARLASANRRTSSSPGLGSRAAGKEQQQPPSQPRALDQANQPAAATAAEPAPIAPNRPSSHYNNQLSRLLQRTPTTQPSGSGRNFLLQSVSIEDGNNSADDADEETGPATMATRLKGKPLTANHQLAKGGSSSGGSSGSIETRDNLPASQGSAAADSGANQRPPQPPPTRRRTPIVVVANKCDLDTNSSQLDQDEIERLVCDQWRNSFVRCSAKEALNIDRVFKELLRQARAPEILSQFVIDDHQQRRQSLPVLKNQLSAHHVKGLRSLYNQQQQQNSTGSNSKMTSQQQQQQQEPRPASSASGTIGGATSDDSQCAIM